MNVTAQFTLWVRCSATLAVVVLHTSANGVNRLTFGSDAWWLANLLDACCRSAVPLFVLLSGGIFLNASRFADQTQDKRFFQSRWQRLWRPLLGWSLFYSVWLTGKQLLQQAAQPDFALTSTGANLLWQQLLAWLQGQPYFHLWFLYLLPPLYYVTPALSRYWQTKSSQQQNQLTVGALICLVLLHSSWFLLDLPSALWPLWFVAYLPYFVLGGWLLRPALQTNCWQVSPQWSQQYPAAYGQNALALLALLATVMLIAYGYYWQNQQATPFWQQRFSYSYHRLSLPVLMNTLLIWYCLLQLFTRHWQRRLQLSANQQPGKLLQTLSNYSFGIYLVHPVFLDSSELLKQRWLAAATNPAADLFNVATAVVQAAATPTNVPALPAQTSLWQYSMLLAAQLGFIFGLSILSCRLAQKIGIGHWFGIRAELKGTN